MHANKISAGALEHYVVSNAKKVIPENVKTWWHDYRQSMRSAEKENFGNDEISEHVEMATWGVEEADARNKAEASKSDNRGVSGWRSLTRYSTQVLERNWHLLMLFTRVSSSSEYL